jgi:hypothetical protein
LVVGALGHRAVGASHLVVVLLLLMLVVGVMLVVVLLVLLGAAFIAAAAAVSHLPRRCPGRWARCLPQKVPVAQREVSSQQAYR